jgi:hypothetical protein
VRLGVGCGSAHGAEGRHRQPPYTVRIVGRG